MVDPNGAVTSYQFDPFQRLIRVTHPVPGTGQHESPVEQYVYDAVGQLLELRVRDTEGWRITEYDYDDLGRRRREIAPPDVAGQRPVTRYAYDLRDNVSALTRGDNTVTVHEYDKRDRLVRTTLPDPDGLGPLGHPVTFRDYAADGALRMEAIYDSNDPATLLATWFESDDLGRTVRVVSPDPDGSGPLVAPETIFHYDAMGNQTAVIERISHLATEGTTYRFDNLNRLWMVEQQVAAAETSQSIQVYDRVGNVIRRLEKTSAGADASVYRQTDFLYDHLGRLVVQADPAPEHDGIRPTTYYFHDSVGNLRFERDPAGYWTEFRSDALNRLIAVIEPATEDHPSPVTSFEYTIAGELYAVVDPLGRRTEYAYDRLGRRIFERLPMVDGQVPAVETRYDLVGNPVSIRDTDGNLTLFQYDALDRVIAVSENGVAATRRYDGFGRLTAETDPLGATTQYVYDRLGRRTSVAPPHPDGLAPYDATLDDDQVAYQGAWPSAENGFLGGHHFAAGDSDDEATATWSFAALRPGATYEVLATWDPDPRNTDQARYALEEGGELLRSPVLVDQQSITSDVVDRDRSWQRVTTFVATGTSLDVVLEPASSFGRVVADGVRVVEMFGTTYTGYDVRGNVVAETDGMGNTQRYTHDLRSNRTSVTDANGDTTRLTYDLLGRLAAVTDPMGNVTRYAYDDLDRKIGETVERGGSTATTRYVYDAQGNVQWIVDRMGGTHTFRYDALGRLKEESWFRNEADALADTGRLNTVLRTYDAAGRLTGAMDEAGSYWFAYDALDRTRVTAIDLIGTPEIVLVSDYARLDALRDSVSVTIGGESDAINLFHYDQHRRLDRIEQTGAGVADKRVELGYSPLSQLTRIDRFADLAGSHLVASSVFEYDGQARLTSLVHRQGANALADYQWWRDAAGRVAQFVSAADGVTRYAYDGRGQLAAAVYAESADESFEYDANGNRSSADYVVGERNLLESDGVYRYEYDVQGNRTRRVELGTGRATEYRWDPSNRLVEILERDEVDGPVTRSIEYAYDLFGRRIGKAIAPAIGPAEIERFVYDGEHIALRFSQGNLVNRYLHGPLIDQILADEQIDPQTGASTIVWPLADNLGTVRDLATYDDTEEITSIANHIVYDAFGGVASESEAAIDHVFGFTGRETDDESDLYYYRARYYDPGIGQFISEDPLGLHAGDANTRRYVGNSPTNQVDPTGLYGEDIHYYFTYYLARYLGLDQPSGWVNSQDAPVSEAYIIAYFANRVDYDVVTKPVGADVFARSRFHLPDPNDWHGVRANDNRIRAGLRAVGAAGDIEMFGLLLHVYQDSHAHQGFGDLVGHAVDSKPDRPYFHLTRDYAMAQRVYLEMESLLLARRGLTRGVHDAEINALLNGKSFEDFWERVKWVMIQPPRADDALGTRIVAWQQLIRKDFNGATPRYDDYSGALKNRLSEQFRRVSDKVPEWYGNGYSHKKYWRNWQPVEQAELPPWRINSRARDPNKWAREIGKPRYGEPKY